VEKALLRASKAAKTADKKALAFKTLLERVREHLDTGAPVRVMGLDDDQQLLLRDLHLLTIKPAMYIANVADTGFVDNPHLDKLRDLAARENASVIPVCAAIESDLVEMNAEEQQMFLADMGLEEPGLNRIIRAGYTLLGLQTYFTAGEKEVRAWTVKIGASAPQAAAVIHTDFEKGFIRAEVIGYQDFINCKGEQGAKDAGKWRLEGKEYTVKDGDIIHFRFNV